MCGEAEKERNPFPQEPLDWAGSMATRNELEVPQFGAAPARSPPQPPLRVTLPVPGARGRCLVASGQEGTCPLQVCPFSHCLGSRLFPVLRARLPLLTFAASFHLGQCLEQPRGILEQQSFMDEIISSS